jgi:hypothetical protein
MVGGEGAVMTPLRFVSKKNKLKPSAKELAAKELARMARGHGLSPTDSDGLVKQFTKSVLETALSEEVSGHFADGWLAAETYC